MLLIKLIIVKLFSVSQNVHWDTEIEKNLLSEATRWAQGRNSWTRKKQEMT
jgi:hypothetical protein